MVMQGTSLRVVQALAGHRTIAVTEKYMHLRPSATDEILKGMRIRATAVAPVARNWRRGFAYFTESLRTRGSGSNGNMSQSSYRPK